MRFNTKQVMTLQWFQVSKRPKKGSANDQILFYLCFLRRVLPQSGETRFRCTSDVAEMRLIIIPV